MKNKITKNIWNILVCPHCKSLLHNSNKGATCNECQSHYKYTTLGGIDLRLQQPKSHIHNFSLGTPLQSDSNCAFRKLTINSDPEVDFSNVEIPFHLTKEVLSYFPKARTKESLVLDLGCGGMIHKNVCEHAGFEYVGIDYNQRAQICGDAHSLPFKDDSFEFILSIAVLEHIRFPFIAMKEAYRVLKPNGIFIGTVAFLEPFHGDSFYHHTHLGTYNSLQEGGFTIERICPSNEWSVLKAQAIMSLFPNMPSFLATSIVMPIYIFHKLWWKIIGNFDKRRTEEIRIRNTTGAFTFTARKIIV